MHAVAIIVEYNPLHNGHLHHLHETKKLFPDSIIIAILNGNFLQRGEPALLNKYERTQLALLAGVDLVVELPFAFGTQRADIFARGAVRLAQGLGAEALVYGSENEAQPNTPLDALKPNEKLAFFYEQITQETKQNLTPVPIPRIKTQYNDMTITDTSFASATALRQKILHEDITKIKNYVPDYVFDMLKQSNDHLGDINAYFPYLQYTLTQTQTNTALAQFGLAKSMNKALETTTTFATFFAQIHHKHTSKTHIQRALTYRLTRTIQSTLDEATNSIWTRVLGVSSAGQKYLKYIKTAKKLNVPLIPKIKDLPSAHYELQYNSLIAYAKLTNRSIHTSIVQENSNNIIRQ